MLNYKGCLLTIIFFIAIVVFPGRVAATTLTDNKESHPLIHSLSINTGASFVASSVEDDVREPVPSADKVYIHSAVPLHLKYSFSFTNPSLAHYLPGGYQGIGVGLLNFGALEPHGMSTAVRNIGYPVTTYVFQGGPFRHFNSKISLNYEWNFGASFGWKPESAANRHFNLTVGSRVNAYLNLNMSVVWKLNPHTSLFAGVTVSHFSNGNTSFPNPGLNSFGLKIGAVYTLNPEKGIKESVVPDTLKRRKLEYDIMGWGSTRKRVYRGGEHPVLLPGHFACAGISFAPMVSLNTWWRLGGSADIQWDRSADMKRNYIQGTTTDDILFKTPSFWRQVSVGLSAHGELRMPIFAVNVGIGYNLIAPTENRGTYQNIALKTYVCKHLFLNIGYQLRNFHQQSSLMLGLGCTV